MAFRNRWRRQRVGPELREDITPKNILMVGPTGVGKTEIARRLAKLADAPFVKVWGGCWVVGGRGWHGLQRTSRHPRMCQAWRVARGPPTVSEQCL